MTEANLILEINNELSLSCALPYSLNEAEAKRIIKRAAAYFYDNYQYAVEDRYIIIPHDVFTHTDFKSKRMITMPDCVVSVYDMREMSGIGLFGNIDRDFSDSKLLGADMNLSPFQGDNLVFKTAMYSLFDLAKAYLLETVAHSWNRNTKRITVMGRTPAKDAVVRTMVKIPDESLYDDELFVRYCLAQAKITLGRTLSVFSYNLPGSVTINFDGIKQDGKDEMLAILEQINNEQMPDFFLQWN